MPNYGMLVMLRTDADSVPANLAGTEDDAFVDDRASPEVFTLALLEVLRIS